MTVAASATDAAAIAHIAGRYSYAPVRGRDEAHYLIRARAQFQLAIERDGDAWIIHDRVTGIFGAGESPSEAIRDFQRATTEHLDVLERQDSLSDDLQAQLRYLRDRV